MAAEETALVGRTIAGKFRVERLLGAGAMGEVYVAEQLALGKKVAIKVLHRHLAGEPGIAKRFHREARAASILEHPNCIQVTDFGEEQGLLYIAMELLSGRDLLKVIRGEGPLPLGRIAHLMGQVLGALDEAHAKGVVHRDLKPENVMVSDLRGQRDFVKVCDFGIAKLTAERDSVSAITVAGMVCGTPEYMSPEQARGDELDGRSDLYAAACILYQMVVGDVPFRAGSALGVVTKHLMEPPEPPSKRRPELQVAPALEALIMRGLAKEPAGRPASAAEMKLELEAIAAALDPGWRGGSGQLAARTPTPVSDAALGLAPTVEHRSSSAEQPARGRSRGALLAVLGGALLIGGFGVVSWYALRVAGRGVKAKVEAPAAPLVAPPPAQLAPPPVRAAESPPPPVEQVAPAALVAHHEASHRHGAAARAHAAEKAAPAEKAPSPVEAPKPRGFAAVLAEAKALFDDGDPEKAAPRFEEAARLSPDNPGVHRELGKCYSRMGQRERSVKEFRRYLELAPNASDAAIYRAIVK